MSKHVNEHDLELLREGRKEILSDDPDDNACTCERDKIYEKIIEIDIECPIHGFDNVEDRDWYRTRKDNITAGYPI